MVYLYQSLFAVLLLVDGLQQVQYRAVGIWVPATVASADGYCHAGHVEAALKHVDNILLHVLA